jgi:hypothetical protein
LRRPNFKQHIKEIVYLVFYKFKISIKDEKIFLIGIMILSVVSGFAQNVATIKNLKEQQQVLDLTAKLNALELELEKKKLENNALTSKAAGVNTDANITTTDFSTSDPSTTVKEAKGTIKKLKETKEINKKLAKLEKKITKLKTKIDQLNKKIQFTNK